MVVAGEASGDKHAADLVSALKRRLGPERASFFGCAGPLMREAGVAATVEADELAIVGVLEIAMALPTFLSALSTLTAAAEREKPDVVILVDFPEFNLKLAKKLKRIGLPVVYYISPQVWAWRKYRIRGLQRYVDLLLTILPFENDWLARRGFTKTQYVGNPLAQEVAARRDRSQFAKDCGLDPTDPIVSLLPGSRHKEIIRILPVMIESAVAIGKVRREVQFVIATRSGGNRRDVEAALQLKPDRKVRLSVVEDSTYDALAASDAAVIASGTATLEAAITGTPMVIVYRTSALNYLLLKPLVSIDHFGLVNLIAEKRIAAELLQNQFEPDAVSREIVRLLDPVNNRAAREALRSAVERLGSGGASDRAASAIIDLIDHRRD